jgi:hypothetical protein
MTGISLSPDDESPWGIKEGRQLPFYIKVTGISFKVIHNFRPEMIWKGNQKSYINQNADVN